MTDPERRAACTPLPKPKAGRAPAPCRARPDEGSSRTLLGALDALLLVVLKLGVSTAVLASGFRAVSDDDYARVVIAQTFAQAPSLDPSGTSWLPFPFWIYGGAFAVFGTSLTVARSVALGLGAASALLLWAAARTLGASRSGALTGAALGAVFPYSAWLGAAFVPESPTAALIVFGLATLGTARADLRAFGAAALGAACFSRYEAWPAMAVFVACTLLDAWRHARGQTRELAGARARLSLLERWAARAPRGWLVATALLAAAPVALWVLHGIFVHGDAFFFVARVAAYHQALGGAPQAFFTQVSSYPLALLRFEPELAALALVALAVSWRAPDAPPLARYRRPALGLLALLSFLVAGELRGGAPTHHAERALLPIWFALALFGGELAMWLGSRLGQAAARAYVAAGLLLPLVSSGLVRFGAVERQSFGDRSPEIEMGAAARRLAGPDEQLLVGTEDYGYFAVIAAFGDPKRARTLHHRDPRAPESVELLANPEALRSRVAAEQARWLLVPRARKQALAALGSVAAGNATFVLLDTQPP